LAKHIDDNLMRTFSWRSLFKLATHVG